jgi:hypothetical protein
VKKFEMESRKGTGLHESSAKSTQGIFLYRGRRRKNANPIQKVSSEREF